MSEQTDQPTIVSRLKILILKWQAINEQRLTYEDLAEKTGVTDKTLRRWANNTVTTYAAHVLVALCRFFDVTVGDVLVFVNGESEQDQ